MIAEFVVKLKRELGLIAPEDDRCGWTYTTRSYVESFAFREVREEIYTYRCTREWRHPGGHVAKRVGEE